QLGAHGTRYFDAKRCRKVRGLLKARGLKIAVWQLTVEKGAGREPGALAQARSLDGGFLGH
ncbi:hypothetical protein ACC771_18285, partial [Rhizobium ruizarguesonis]